jgi:DnaJ-class molecular chaperone
MSHLKKCDVCGGQVSSDAGKCPHCGDPYVNVTRAVPRRSPQKFLTCSSCNGEGRVSTGIDNHVTCSLCEGVGGRYIST